MKKHYPSVRAIHLYVGLFISPFVLIFSISALVLNHTDYINRINPVKPWGLEVCQFLGREKAK